MSIATHGMSWGRVHRSESERGRSKEGIRGTKETASEGSKCCDVVAEKLNQVRTDRQIRRGYKSLKKGVGGN